MSSRVRIAVRGLAWALPVLLLPASCSDRGNHDCVETPGYCLHSQVCDSETRQCERKCTEHPPRLCPEGTSCDYATGSCRRWCKSDGRTTETTCEDGADDDCDGLTDCADPDCDRFSCGSGCFCGNRTRREVLCNDGKDNNDDGLIDCADPHCVGVLCRASSGPCDVEERCLAGEDTCPANAFAPATTVCRPAAGPCDVEEHCSGSSAECGVDLLATSDQVCRPAAGPCDAPDRCSGSAAACGADQPLADDSSCGTGCVCRAGAANESTCDDLVDNDGDGSADCADVSNCPEGTTCKRSDGSAGTCQANQSCG